MVVVVVAVVGVFVPLVVPFAIVVVVAAPVAVPAVVYMGDKQGGYVMETMFWRTRGNHNKLVSNHK